MNIDLKEAKKMMWRGLEIIASCEIVGALLLRWSLGRWMAATGVLSGLLAFVLFYVGFGFYCCGVKWLIDLSNKVVEVTKNDLILEVRRLYTAFSIVLALVLFVPAYCLWGVFSIGSTCWWSGVWNTIFACHAFMAGIFVFVAAFIGLFLPIAVWGNLHKKK